MRRRRGSWLQSRCHCGGGGGVELGRSDVLAVHFPGFSSRFGMGVNAVTCFMFTLAVEGMLGLLDSCIHGGTEYREGDYILPNDTIIKTESPRECVQCRCRQGLVLCEIESCPALDCEAPVRQRHLCCPHCPASAGESERISDLVIETGAMGPEQKKSSDCFSNGKRFRNGSSWQPVIGPLGVMACVECRCRGGVIICGRVQCGQPACLKPRRLLGQCCPVCPSSAAVTHKTFCLPKLNELFVFRTANMRNNSKRIEYAFLESDRKRQESVKIHSWNLRSKNSVDVLAYSVVPWKEFLERNLQIVGSISRREWRKYSKREKKLRENCEAKCFLKVRSLESSLVDYSVSVKEKCGADEVDLADVMGEPSRGGPGGSQAEN